MVKSGEFNELIKQGSQEEYPNIRSFWLFPSDDGSYTAVLKSQRRIKYERSIVVGR